MTIEATSKEKDYSKHCLNYLQSWHMGTTNKLLQTALLKRTHSRRQPEADFVTNRHKVGENGLGLNCPRHYYQIIQEVLYQQWFRWHGRWCIVGWTVWQIWHWQRRCCHVWWHTNRYNRCSVSDDDEFLGFESILLILAGFIHGFDFKGFYWP